MQRRTMAVLAVAALLAAGIYWWRSRPADTSETEAAAKSTKLPSSALSKKGSKDQKASQGRRSGGASAVSMDDDPIGTLVLEGQVIDESEDPVVGATIVISSNPPRTTKSGEDGSFQFEKLVGRTYAVSARADDMSAGPAMHELTETSDPLVLTARKAASVSVEVVSSKSGEVIPGARVRLRTLEERTQNTDKSGTTTFRGVAAGWHAIVADAEGYAPHSQPVQVAAGTKTTVSARIALTTGAPVLGVVRDEAGKPVAGVRVIPEATSAVFSLTDSRRDGVVTDDKGEFRIPAVAPGTYQLAAIKAGYPRASSRTISADGRSTVKDVVITLKDGAALSGRVVMPDGAAVPWAEVRVQPRDDAGTGFLPGTRQGTADKDGNFEIKGLRIGKVVALASSDAASSELVEVDLSKSKREEISIELSVNGVISGVVVDSSGEPVGDAQVAAAPDFWEGSVGDSFALRGVSSQRTDPGGRFAFRGIPSGKYRIRASRSGNPQNLWSGGGTPASAGDTDIRITLEAEGGLKGQLVFDSGGNPSDFVVTTNFPPGVPVLSDKGEFDIGMLPPGTYDVTFQGKSFAATTVRDVEVKPGAKTAMGSVTVAKGRSISGRVTDENGQAVEGASVVVGLQIIGDGQNLAAAFGAGNDQAQQIKRATTDDNGYFQLSGIGRRPLVIAAEHAAMGRAHGVDVRGGPDSTQVDLRLVSFGSVKGKVMSAGKPVPSVQILASNAAASKNQFVVVSSGADGSFALDRMPAGTYQIKAMSGAFGSASTSGVEVEVVKGASRDAAIEIDKGNIEFAIQISGEGGAKIDSAQAFLFTGKVDVQNGQQVHNVFMGGSGGAKMSFALGGAPVKFPEVTAGEKSVCVIPISGNIQDPTFMKRLNENRMELRTYCEPVVVAESPTSQSHAMVVPPMTPFPEDEGGSESE